MGTLTTYLAQRMQTTGPFSAQLCVEAVWCMACNRAFMICFRVQNWRNDSLDGANAAGQYRFSCSGSIPGVMGVAGGTDGCLATVDQTHTAGSSTASVTVSVGPVLATVSKPKQGNSAALIDLLLPSHCSYVVITDASLPGEHLHTWAWHIMCMLQGPALRSNDSRLAADY